MKPLLRLLTIAIIGVTAIALSAQRRISPVNTPATATQPVNENRQEGDSIDRSRLVQMTDSKGNKILVDTITGKEFVDSAAIKETKKAKIKYPLLYNASISADFFTPLMRAFGQHYGIAEFAAELNLLNRYIPIVEIGLGQAKNTPDDNNYTYRSPISPFFRIGMNYNFMYNSNPDYMVYAGVRYGFSPFKFSVTDISLDNGYWGENDRFETPSQSVTAGYFEILIGLRVKIMGNFSLGWNVRYHSLLHETETKYGQPWYIPGFGSRNSSIGATFSLTYTIPFHKKRTEIPGTQDTPVTETAPDTATSSDQAEPSYQQ